MKYLIFIVFIIFSNFSYATDPSILCNIPFLKSTTPHNLTDTLSAIVHRERQLQSWYRRFVMDDRGILLRYLRQTCNEATGDTPVHLAARVDASFSVIRLIQEEIECMPYKEHDADRVISRKNKRGETPFDILKNNLMETLPDHAIENLDNLLKLYAMQESFTQGVLKRR